MGKLFDVQDFTLNPAEVQNASELIVEKLFETGQLTDLFDIQTGIRNKTQIGFVKSLGIGGGAPAGCEFKEIDGLKLTEKYWDVALQTGVLSYCNTDTPTLLKIMAKWERTYPDFFSEIPDDVLRMTTALLLDHLKRSILAKADFSDTAAATFANGGNFTDGTDLGVFNTFDGRWKQVYGDATIKRFEIAKNSGADYASQKITADEAYAAIEGAFDIADPRLKADEEGMMHVTSDIFWGYIKYIQKTEAQGGYTDKTIAGFNAIEYMGKTIINRVDWTNVIEEFQNDGTKYFLPNRVMFTTKSNIPLGTTNTDDLETLDHYYWKKDHKIYDEYAYYLDAKVLEPYLIAVAY